MSAPVAADVLQELGCEHRTFRTVKGAVLWYAGELARKLGPSAPYERGSTPRSRLEREQDQAAAALVVRCIAKRHWADKTITSERMLEALPIRGEQITYLVAWYDNTEGTGEDLARKWNPRADENPVWKFMRWCKVTERVLRHRMNAEGLLETE